MQKRIPIVVIDDDPAILELLEIFLHTQDFEVFPFGKLSDALAFFNASPNIQMILTDYWVHPEGTATAFYRAIRAEAQLRGAFVAVLAGGDLVGGDANYFASEGVPILQKPYNLSHELLPMLQEALRRNPQIR